MDKQLRWVLLTLCVLAILGSVGVIIAKAHHNGEVMFGMVAADGFAEKPISPWDVAKYGESKKPHPVARRVWYSIRRLIPRSEKQKEAKVKLMPTWVATNCGEPNVNGAFTLNGPDDYVNEHGWHMWLMEGFWHISPGVGNTAPYYYASATDTLPGGTWSAWGGAPTPAPTVAEYVAPTPVAGDSNPYNMVYDNYWYPSTEDAVTPLPVAPAKVTIGTTEYVVFAFQDATDYGFLLFDLVAAEWTRLDTTSALLANYDTHQGAGLFDCGDATHVWLMSGGYTRDSAYYFTCKQFDLTNGAEVSADEVSLTAATITNMGQMADGTFRYFLRSGNNLSLCSYTGGDATATVVATYALPPTGTPAVSELNIASGLPDHAMVVMDDETYYSRRGFLYLFAYLVTADALTPLAATRDDWMTTNRYQTWAGTSNYMQGAFGTEAAADYPVSGFPDFVRLAKLDWDNPPTYTQPYNLLSYPCGRHWYLAGDTLTIGGWGSGGAATGRAFVMYVAPRTLNMGSTIVSTNAVYAPSFTQTLDMGSLITTTNAVYAPTFAEVLALDMGETIRAENRIFDLQLVASADRTPAPSTCQWRSVRAMALPTA